MSAEHDVLYQACTSPFGLVIRGSARALRSARQEMHDDPALIDLAILGPDNDGQIWIVRKDAIHDHLVIPQDAGSAI